MSSRTSMMILSPQSNHGAKIEDDQNATNQITNETTTLVDTTTDSSYLGTTSLISMYLLWFTHLSISRFLKCFSRSFLSTNTIPEIDRCEQICIYVLPSIYYCILYHTIYNFCFRNFTYLNQQNNAPVCSKWIFKCNRQMVQNTWFLQQHKYCQPRK